MTSLDANILTRLMDWAYGTDISPDHLVGGLTMAHYVREGGEAHGRHISGLGGGPDLLFALAADLSFLVWVNDYIEIHKRAVQEVHNLAITPTGLTFGDHVTLLSTAIDHTRLMDSERQWWNKTLYDACAADRAAAMNGFTWSYSEYLDNGIDSINIPHVVATISLLWNFGIAQRQSEPIVAGIIRHLGIQQRLSNDLASTTKERSSGDPGNAVLLMERYLNPSQAIKFVADDLHGHHRLLAVLLNQIPAADPVARTANAIAVGLEGAQRDLDRYNEPPQER